MYDLNDFTPMEQHFLNLVLNENSDQNATIRLAAKTRLAVTLHEIKKSDQKVNQNNC